MDFKKKLKTRRNLAIGYIIAGLVMIGISFFVKTEGDFLSAFGLAVLVCGVVRIRNYRIITRSDERIKQQEIAETDERNVLIADRAKSRAFSIYLMVACIAVIVCAFMGNQLLTQVIGFSVCGLVLLYWISYYIIRKKY